MRSLRGYLRIFPSVLATIFIAGTVTLFVLFPRVVNWLANLTGNMGNPLDFGQGLFHFLIALVIDAVLVYFFILRPVRSFRRAQSSQGLVVRQGKGIGYIDTESVRQQVHAAVTRLPEIARATVKIENQTGKAKVELNLWTIGNITGSRKKEEIRRELKKVLEEQLGVRMAGEPIINMELIPAAPIVVPAPKLDPRNELPANVRQRPDLEIELPTKTEAPKSEPVKTEAYVPPPVVSPANTATVAAAPPPTPPVTSAGNDDTPIIGRRSLFSSMADALHGDQTPDKTAVAKQATDPDADTAVQPDVTTEVIDKAGEKKD